MLGQMIAAHKRLLAFDADKLLFAGVCALVSRQLIGTGESTFAIGPLADEGLLAGVDALMGLEMGGFKVVFAAVGMVTFENPSAILALTVRRCG